MGIKALTKLLMGHKKALGLLAEVVAIVGKLTRTWEVLCSSVTLMSSFSREGGRYLKPSHLKSYLRIFHGS